MGNGEVGNGEVGRHGLGQPCKLLQSGLGQSPSGSRIWCVLGVIYMTPGGSNFNDIPENQLTIVRAV